MSCIKISNQIQSKMKAEKKYKPVLTASLQSCVINFEFLPILSPNFTASLTTSFTGKILLTRPARGRICAIRKLIGTNAYLPLTTCLQLP